MINTNITPKSQHDAQAKRILARRAEKASRAPVVVADDTDEDIDGAPASNADTNENTVDPVVDPVVPAPIQYHEMSVKDLRVECTKLGIKYKKKDTIPMLIEKLTAE